MKKLRSDLLEILKCMMQYCWTTFTMLCTRTQNLFIFELEVCILWQTSPQTPTSSPLANTILLSVCTCSAFSDSTYQYDIIFVFLWLSIVPSESIYIVAQVGFPSFSWLTNVHCVCTYIWTKKVWCIYIPYIYVHVHTHIYISFICMCTVRFFLYFGYCD